MKLEFSRRIFEKYPNFKLSLVHHMRADLFYAGGRTNMTKQIFAFRNLRTRLKRGMSRDQSPER
jgi:hypothetical protein